MIAYLNGVNVLNGKKKKGKKAFEKLKATGKKLNEKRKELDKKIIAKHKELAKKAGAGLKRFAKINKTIAEKALIKALEKNLLGLSSRLKVTYKVSPDAVKGLFKTMNVDFKKIAAAINKGDKKQPAIIGEYRRLNRTVVRSKSLRGMPVKPMELQPQGENQSDGSYRAKRRLHSEAMRKYRTDLKAYLNKGKLSGDEDGAGSGGDAEATAETVKQGVNLIQKIVEFFKKRKESKQGDSETVEAMANSVDADPNIEKVDENGKSLPVSDEAKEINKLDQESGAEEKGGMMSNKPLLIGGALALAVGGYFLLKKK
jgi:hypothetical protein